MPYHLLSVHRPLPRACVPLGVLALTLALAACSTNAATPTSRATSPAGASPAAASPTSAAGVGGGVRTQVVGGVATASDNLRATVSAAVSPITGTVSAAGTQVANRVGGAVATSTAQSSVEIVNVAPGGAVPTITVRNGGGDRVNLSGWILMLGDIPVLIPVTRDAGLGPGQQLQMHLGPGTNTPTDLYLDQVQSGARDKVRSGGWVALVTLRSGIASIYQIP